MLFETVDIPGLLKITPRKFEDERGYFMETFRSSLLSEKVGSDIQFVQDNHSSSLKKNTVRGLHYQSPPRDQGKLVRCTRGALLDVVVDVRVGSPTYGQHAKFVLSAENAVQLWIPSGFLHGFITLSDHTDMSYKCTDYYAPDCEGAVMWNDKTLAIDWGVSAEDVIISPKDKLAEMFSDFTSPFRGEA